MTTQQDVFATRTGVVLSDTDDRARRAVSAFRSLQPTLNSYARVLTGNQNVRIEMSANSNGSTDGKRIYFRPPIALGDKTPHTRRLCDKRDENLQLQCKACATREEVLVTIYHEIAHIVFDSFAKPSDQDIVEVISHAVEEAGGKYADAIARRIKAEPFYRKNSYIALAGLISPFLPILVNALEDARVNRELFKARKGTKIMFSADLWKVFNEGVEQRGPDGKIKVVKWTEYPLNQQALVGLFCKAAGYDYSNWFVPMVVEALNDEQITTLVARMDKIRSAAGVYALSFPILTRLRELGFCKSEIDPNIPDEEGTDESGESPDTKEKQDNKESGDPQPRGSEPEPGGSPEPDKSDQPSDSGSGEDESDGERPPSDGGSDDVAPPSESGGAGGGDEREQASDDLETERGRSGDGEADEGSDSSSSSDEELSNDSDDGSDIEDTSVSDRGGQSEEPSDDRDADEGCPSEGDTDDQESSEVPSDPDTASDSGGDDDSTESHPERGGATADDTSPDGETESPEESESPTGVDDEDEEPIDTGADLGKGGIELIEHEENDDKPLDYGTAEECQMGLEKWGDHDEVPRHVDENWTERNAIETALVQSLYFETPSREIHGVVEVKYSDMEGWGTFGRGGRRTGTTGDFRPGESILGPALLRMRVAFSDNQRGKELRGLRSGRVNPRALGKRVHFDDERLFRRKLLPGKRNYFVLIGMDVSGSTSGVNIILEKRAVMAQAELLDRMGIPFSIYAHSGHYTESGMGRAGGADLVMFSIKEPRELWSEQTRMRLEQIGPYAMNLDGHSLEYYRKRLDESNATDKVLLYYSDGKMPAENHNEELAILRREIRICKQRNYTLLGVGIRTDSPKRHGLDTVQVDEDADVSKVVKHLEKRLLAS